MRRVQWQWARGVQSDGERGRKTGQRARWAETQVGKRVRSMGRRVEKKVTK